MRDIIFHNKYFLITYKNLAFSFLLLAFTLVLIFIIRNKFRKKQNKQVFWIYPFLLLFAFSGISAILMPDFFYNILWSNKIYNLSPWRFSVVILIIFANLFLVKEIKIWIKKRGLFTNNAAFLSFSVVLWAISIHYSLKLMLKKYLSVIDKPLFHISKIEINLNDFFFLIISIALTFLLILFIRLGFERLEKKDKIEKSTATALTKILQYFIWTLVIVLILQNIGFNINALLAGSAALLVGIGLGIQQLFNDFASGIILLTEQNNKIGDIVEADDIEGKIIDVGFRTTTILTRDNIKVIIPNSKLVSQKVINWTKGEKFARVGIDIGVAYGSDLKKVKNILLEIAKKHDEVIKQPEPEVLFLEFGDSSLNLKLYFYTRKVLDRKKIISDLLFEIYDTFNQENIEIPFPQMDVHFQRKEV